MLGQAVGCRFPGYYGTGFFSLIISVATSLRLFFAKQYRRSVVAIVTVNQAFAEQLERRQRRDIHLIYNGFDPEDLASSGSQSFPRF